MQKKNLSEKLLEIAEFAFYKYPFSEFILGQYCSALILSGEVEKSINVLKENEHKFLNSPYIQEFYINAYLELKLFSLAKTHLHELLKILTTDKEDVDVFTLDLVEFAKMCMDDNNFEEALFYFDSIELFSHLPKEDLVDYAVCYDELGENEKAKELYNKYLDNNPFDDIVWVQLGLVLYKLQEYEQSIDAIKNSLALNPDNLDALRALSSVYEHLQMNKEAIKCMDECVEKSFAKGEKESIVSDLYYIGKLYFLDKNFKQALTVFKKIETIDNSFQELKAAFYAVDIALGKIEINDNSAKGKEKFTKTVKEILKFAPEWINFLLLSCDWINGNKSALICIDAELKSFNNIYF